MIIGRWNIKCKLKAYRPLEYQMQIEKFLWIVIEKLTMICLCTLTHMCDGNYEDNDSQNFDFSLTQVVC